MKTIVIAAILAACFVTPAFAQSATGVGVGTGIATSKSTSQAVAIGGGNATGGTASSALTVNASTPPVQTVNQVTSGTQSIRNVPTVFSPGLTAAGLETCLGSVSGGGGWLGTGFSFGTTIPDPGCATRLDARTLWSFGLKKAAVARLCLSIDIYNSMPEICAQYLPRAQSQPVAVAAIEAPPDWRGAYNSAQPIMLIEGKTGRQRLCNEYDEGQQRCRVWASTHTHTPKKMAVAKITRTPPPPLPKIITDPPPASPKAADEIPSGAATLGSASIGKAAN